MHSQKPFRVTHLLGPLVGVAHYGTVNNPLLEDDSPLTAIGSSQEAGLLPQAATTTTSPAHCLSQNLQSTRTLPCSVVLSPEALHTQVQYYCEASEPLLPCSHIRHSLNPTTLLPQPANTTPSYYHCPPTVLSGVEEARLGLGEKQGKEKTCARGSLTRLTRKRCRNSGKAYVSTAGKAVPAKRYVEQDCECRHECLARLGTIADREAAHRRFWDIGDFEKQNAYLAQSVMLVPSNNSSSSRGKDPDPLQQERRMRTVRRIYYVKIKVCVCIYLVKFTQL